MEPVKEVTESEPSWSTMPNEIRSLVVKQLDVESSISLRQCSRKDLKTVNAFAKKQKIDVILKYFRKRIFIEIRKCETARSICAWVIQSCKKRRRARITKVTHINSKGQNVHCISAKPLVYSKTAFGIIGKIANERLFSVSTLELDFGGFNGRVNFGAPISVEKLVLCLSLKFVYVRVLCDPNVLYEKAEFKESEEMTIQSVSPLMEQILANKTYLLQVTQDVENSYRIAFPVDHKVESIEDASSRYMKFISNVPWFTSTLGNEPLQTEITSLYFLKMFMVIRATLTSDPVDYLTSDMGNYQEVVKFVERVRPRVLKHGVIPLFMASFVSSPAEFSASDDYKDSRYLQMFVCMHMRIGASDDRINQRFYEILGEIRRIMDQRNEHAD